MKTLIVADIDSLYHETNTDSKRVDYVTLVEGLKHGSGFDVRHMVAYAQIMSEGFGKLLTRCGFEVVTEQNIHSHRLCIDTVSLAEDFDCVVLLSTRYYLAPLIMNLKRRGKRVCVFGYKTHGHIRNLAEYHDIDTLIDENYATPNTAE